MVLSFWMENFFLVPLQRFNSPNYHLQKLSSLIHYLIFFFSPSKWKQTKCCWLETEALTPLYVSGHVTSFYNLWDMPISHCFMGGIDFQMMTLFLIKSTLVSRCVHTHEIVCLISRITVSSPYFLDKTLSSVSMGFTIHLWEKYPSGCHE